MSLKILVVDDEEMQREMLKGFLQKQGFQVLTAADGREALRLFADLPLQLVLLDHRMPDLTGDQVLARMKEINPLTRAIMITAFGAVDTAVRVMKLGADDFLEKPVDLTLLLAKLRAIEQEFEVRAEAEEVNIRLKRDQLPLEVIGSSTAMKNLLSLTVRIAPSPWTVLIRGETGTGKELFARLIHLLGPRPKAPYITVNCAAIPENLFESELFGHEKGAFTGAVNRKKGRFELADGGTLFLDEIGELPLALQAKLLRALQEKKITRVGGVEEIAIEVRLLAATNRDLKEMVAAGQFREDLYYRLHVLELEIPPLRQRRGDIPEFIDFFLQRFGLQGVSFDREALTRLVKYPFPGNVRELEHIIQRTVTLARSSTITSADLPPELNQRPAAPNGGLEEQLEEMERNLLRQALAKHDQIQTRAAEELGISERVLRYKMAKLGLKR